MENKGVILELRKNKAIVLNNMCEYVKIKRVDGMFIGQLVEYSTIDKKTNISYIVAISGIAAIFIFISSYYMFFNNINPQVFAYVHLDIDPSIEFLIDEHNSVISLNPINSEAKIISDSSDFKGMDIYDAISNILITLEDNGYVKYDSENLILLSASATLKPESSEKENNENLFVLTNTLNDVKMKIENNKNIDFSVEVICASSGIKKSSSELNMSIGRYALYSKAVEKGINITTQEAKYIPLTELIQYVSPKIPNVRTEMTTDNSVKVTAKPNNSIMSTAETTLNLPTPIKNSNEKNATNNIGKSPTHSTPTPSSTPTVISITPVTTITKDTGSNSTLLVTTKPITSQISSPLPTAIPSPNSTTSTPTSTSTTPSPTYTPTSTTIPTQLETPNPNTSFEATPSPTVENSSPTHIRNRERGNPFRTELQDDTLLNSDKPLTPHEGIPDEPSAPPHEGIPDVSPTQKEILPIPEGKSDFPSTKHPLPFPEDKPSIVPPPSNIVPFTEEKPPVDPSFDNVPLPECESKPRGKRTEIQD